MLAFFRTFCALILLRIILTPQLASAIVIELNFYGNFNNTQYNTFNQAKSFWENKLTGYESGLILPPISIDTNATAIDGVGNVLGSAGPTYVWSTSDYTYTAEGEMNFDTADLNDMENNGSLESVILHEMAHVLGFGTLWEYNGVYQDGSGAYTGANALEQWRTEFGQTNATYIPIELGGGSGTADGHWDEITWGSNFTGITDGNGNDMRNELMGGWLNQPTFVSNMTIMSFADIGYTVAPIPIPASFILFVSGITGLFGFKKLKNQI